jgi:hypothetical protein
VLHRECSRLDAVLLLVKNHLAILEVNSSHGHLRVMSSGRINTGQEQWPYSPWHTASTAPEAVSHGVMPAERHQAITKQARKTNHLERFNNTLRQRLARLVRATVSFSKQGETHLGASKCFICHYNLEKAAALPV